MRSAKSGNPVLAAYDLVSDRSESTDLLADGAGPGWVAELRDVLINYPTTCRRVAHQADEDPSVPVRTRLRLAVDRNN
jgi:hypothetical protein